MHYDVSSGRSEVKHHLKTAIISSLAILVLLILAGLAYTWYNGQQPPGEAKTAATDELQAQAIKPRTVNPKVPESAAVEVLTSPVAPGDNAMISVKTNPTSTCQISVVYNKVPSHDSGLAPKKANDFGSVSWAWSVPGSTPLGDWPVTVTCQFYGKSAVVSQNLRVEKSTAAAD